MKSYLITDPKYYSDNITIFEKTLDTILQNSSPDMICFRDKTSKNRDELIDVFVQVCKKHNIQEIYINGIIESAKQYSLTGVHLSSLQFDQITMAKSLGLKVIVSCHTEDEIIIALSKKVDAITYSPIFLTPNKGNPKGVEELIRVIKKYPIDIIALGGITSENHLYEIQNSGAYGFASIRYFIK